MDNTKSTTKFSQVVVSAIVMLGVSLLYVGVVVPATAGIFSHGNFKSLVITSAVIAVIGAVIASLAGVQTYNHDDDDSDEETDSVGGQAVVVALLAIFLIINLIVSAIVASNTSANTILGAATSIFGIGTLDSAGNPTHGAMIWIGVMHAASWSFMAGSMAFCIRFLREFGLTFRNGLKKIDRSGSQDELLEMLAEAVSIDREVTSKWIDMQDDLDRFLESPSIYLIGGRLRADSTAAIDNIAETRVDATADWEDVSAYLDTVRESKSIIDECLATANENGYDGLPGEAADVYKKISGRHPSENDISDASRLFAVKLDTLNQLASAKRKGITAGFMALGGGK